MKVFFVVVTSLLAMVVPFQASSILLPPPHPCQGKLINETVYGWKSCSIFYICNGKNAGQFRKCLNGYYYDMDKGHCRYDVGNKYQCKNNAYPWGNINPCRFYESEKYFPVPNDCSRFIQCDNGIPAIQTCPNGLLYNPRLRVCDWPTNVKCR